MTLKCKNCNHDIVLSGVDKEQVILHVSYHDGLYQKCSYCNCDNPERKSVPVFCKNCGHEIKKQKGRLLHIIENNPEPCSILRHLPRSTNIRCRSGLSMGTPCGCEKPEPEGA